MEYVSSEFLTPAMKALAAGKSGMPEHLTTAGVKAIGKIVFTGNILAADTVTFNGVAFTAKAEAAPAVGKIVFTGNILADDVVVINGVTFTAMASGAAGEVQFNVGVSLDASLDALITKLQACTNVLVSYATYTKTDTNTAVTSTADTNNSAHNAVVLSSTHDSVVVTAPVGGVSAASAVQFDVKGTLSLSLDQLVSQMNASVNALVSIATYTKTDTNTALTATWDAYSAAANSVLVASTHSTVVLTQPAGGRVVTVISPDTENTSIDIEAALDVDQNFTLADGSEFQRKTILLYGAAGDGNAVITPANLTGGTTITLDTDGDWIKLEFLNGAWAKIAGVGDTIA